MATIRPVGSINTYSTFTNGVTNTTSDDEITGLSYSAGTLSWVDLGTNDLINSGGGNDSVLGNLGNDTIDAGDGNDYAHGGQGDDSILGGAGNDTLVGGKGSDTVDGGAGDDVIDESSITSGDGTNLFYGRAGNDRIYGAQNKDTILGGVGDDFIVGNGGDDSLTGGIGADSFYGGTGSDSILLGDAATPVDSSADYVYYNIHSGANDGNDTVTGFQQGVDKIRLVDIASPANIGSATTSLTPVSINDNLSSVASISGNVVTFTNGTTVTFSGVTNIAWSDFDGYIDRAPVIDTNSGEDSNVLYDENSTAVVATVHASDPESGTVTYTIEGSDAALFDINASTGAVTWKASPNFEQPQDAGSDNFYNFTVRATDGLGASDTIGYTVSVVDVDDKPIVVNDTASADGVTYRDGQNVQEYDADNVITSVLSDSNTLFATDPDADAVSASSIVYTITDLPEYGFLAYNNGTSALGLGATFTQADLDAGLVSYTNNLGRGGSSSPSVQDSFSFTVAGAGGTASTAGTFYFDVLQKNNAPVFTDFGNAASGSSPDITVTEDASQSTLIDSSVTLTDADNVPLTGGHVLVHVSANGNSGDQLSVKASGTLTLSGSDVLIAGTVIGSIDATLNGVDGADLQINLNANATTARVRTLIQQLTFKTTANSSGDKTLVVTVNDGGLDISDAGGTLHIPAAEASQEAIIRVTNVDDAPVITTNSGSDVSVTYAENSTVAVTTVAASDDEGNAITYSLSGVDSALFTIDGSTGVVTWVASPNYENPLDVGTDNIYNFSVIASDGSMTDSIGYTVTVTDANDAPVISTNSGSAVSVVLNENSAGTIATVAASDADSGQTVTFSLSGSDAALFTVDASTGAVTWASEANHDYENPQDSGSNNIYNFTVVATDNGTGSLTDTIAYAVTVQDGNDAPVIGMDPSNAGVHVTVGELSDTFGNVLATDPNSDSITYTLSGADAALFTIDSQGTVHWASDAVHDYESPQDSGSDNVYEFTVIATDNGNPSLSDSAQVFVTISDENEAPVISNNSGNDVSVSYVESRSDAVADVDATDVDASQSLTYALTGSDASLFEIDASTGVVTWISQPTYADPQDAGSNGVYDFTVTVSDDGNPSKSDSINYSVTVTDADDAPTVINDTASSDGVSYLDGLNVGEFEADNIIPGSLAEAGTLLSSDVDLGGASAGDIVYTITKNPELGFLVYNAERALSEGDTFTQEDLDNGLVSYTNDGGRGAGITGLVGRDSFEFSVYGTGADFTSAAGTYWFDILPQNTGPAFTQFGNAAAGSAPDLIVSEDAGFALVDNSITLTDAENANFGGGFLLAEFTANGNSHDALTVLNGTVGGFTVSLNGSEVTVDGPTAGSADAAVIGTIDLEDNGVGGNDLRINLNDNATVAYTRALIQQIAFKNTSNEDSTGDRTLVVTVNDGGLQFSEDGVDYDIAAKETSGTAIIRVNTVNDAPIISTNSGSDVSFTYVENCTDDVATVAASDEENHTLTYSLSGSDSALFAINSITGVVTWVSSPDYDLPQDAGSDNVYDFTVTVTDNGSPSATDSIHYTVTVSDVNEAPVAVSDSYTVSDDGITSSEGNFVSGDLLSNDTKPDKDETHVIGAAGVSDGVEVEFGTETEVTVQGSYGYLSVDSSGNFSYTVTDDSLPQGSEVTDTFYYRLDDGRGLSDTTSVTFTVTGSNDAPAAVGDEGYDVSADSDTAVTGNVLVNDTDVDLGSTLSLQLPETSGSDWFVPTLLDPSIAPLLNGYVFSASINSESDPLDVYRLEVAGEDSVTVKVQGSQDLVLGWFTSDGTYLDHANVTGAGGSESHTFGAGSYYIKVRTSGGNWSGSDGGYTVTVTDAAAPDYWAQVSESTPSEDVGVTLNINGPSLEFSSTFVAGGTDVDGSYGTFHFDNDGSFSYLVDTTDADTLALSDGETVTDTATYTVYDEHGASSTGTVTVTLYGVNDAPTATSDTASVSDNGYASDGDTVSGNVLTDGTSDSDPDTGDTVTVVGYGDTASADDVTSGSLADGFNGTYGKLILLSDGSYTYEVTDSALSEGEMVTDTFHYRIEDQHGLSSEATLTITVTGVNDAPEADHDHDSVDADDGTQFSGNVLSNDSDIDHCDSFTFAWNAETPFVPELPVTSEGFVYNGTVEFDNPYYGMLPTDWFKFTVSEGHSFHLDLASTDSNSDVAFLLYDASGAFVRAVQEYSDNTSESLDVSEAGTYYVAVFAMGESGAPVYTLSGVEDASVPGSAVDLTGTLSEEFGIGIDWYAGYGSIDETRVWLINSEAEYGTFVANSDGTWTYQVDTSNAEVLGLGGAYDHLTETFSYTITDEQGATSEATLTITIYGVNDAPLAFSDSNSVSEAPLSTADGNTVSGNVLTDVNALSESDYDPDTNDSLTVSGYSYTPEFSMGAIQYEAAISGADVGSTDETAYEMSMGSLFVGGIGDGEYHDRFKIHLESGSYGVIYGDESPGVVLTAVPGQTGMGTFLPVNGSSQVDTFVLLTISEAGDYYFDVNTNGTQSSYVFGIYSETSTTGSNGSEVEAAHGTFTISDNGAYTYTVTDHALSEGEVVTDTVTYTITDGELTDTAKLTITVTGANDAPISSDDDITLWATDADLSVSGNVLTNDSDVDHGAVMLVSDDYVSEGVYGSVIISANGSYAYTLDVDYSDDMRALAHGESLEDAFVYTVNDEFGASADGTLTVKLLGVNDQVELTGGYSEDTLSLGTGGTYTFSGSENLTVADPDAGEQLTVTISAQNAVVDLSDTTGLTFIDGSDNTDYLQFSGSVGDVNRWLENLTVTAGSELDDGGVLVQVEDGNEDGTFVQSYFLNVKVVDDNFGTHGMIGSMLSTTDMTFTNFSPDKPVRFRDDSASEFVVSYDGSDTVLTHDSGGTVTLGGYTGALGTESIQFQNGTVLQTVGQSGGKANLTGSLVAGGDLLVGSGYADVIKGLNGTDRLFGGAGNDQIRGGKDGDTIVGGVGNDVLYGGETATDDDAADTFAYTYGDNATEGNDIIYGFSTTVGYQDVIQFLGASMTDVSVTQFGNDTMVTLRDEAVSGVSAVTTIKLVGVTATNVTADNFDFGTPG